MKFAKRIKIDLKKATLAFAGVALAFAFVHERGPGIPESSLAEVRAASFEVKVSTVGHVDTASAFHVTSQVRGDRGKIVQIVEDGAHVEKGDSLVAYDRTFFESEVQRLTGEVKSRESVLEYQSQMLKLAKSEIEKLIAHQHHEFVTAGQERSRYGAYIKELSQLKAQGYSIESEIAQAKRKEESSAALVKKAEADLDRLRRESVFKLAQAISEVTKAQGELATMKAALVQAVAELAKTVILAPISGFVVLEEVAAPGDTRHKLRVGDTVWQGQPVLYLPDSSAMLVKTQVREVDLHRLREGQQASVEVDAFPGTQLQGSVEQIGALAVEGAGSPDKNFQFTVRLTGQDARLRPGMTARVSIMVERVKEVPVVPVAALFGESGAQRVFVLEGRHLVERPVGVGRWNEDLVEITSGLKPGEKVSLVRP